MDNIQKCALHFLNLINTTSYIFHISNRTVRVISLNFVEKDFYHLAGFQYLDEDNFIRIYTQISVQKTIH